MKTRRYKIDGVWFLEIISKSYGALRHLETEYKEKGKKTWLNAFNVLDGNWLLTVQLGAGIK
jgi:hypothetical protein